VKNAAAPINNLEDILTSSYKVTIVEYGSTYEFFQTSQYETHRKIWYRIQAHNSFVGNTSEAVKLVRGKDDYVFIYDGPVVRHLANNQPCDLITGKIYFSRFKNTGMRKKNAKTLICYARLTLDSRNARNRSRTGKTCFVFFNLFVKISGRISTVVGRGYFSHSSSHSENVAVCSQGMYIYALFFHLLLDQGKGFVIIFNNRLHVRQKEQIKRK